MNKAAVIGDPISHSLSPIIFDQLKKIENVDDLTYEAIKVPVTELATWIKGARSTFLGLNVTLPHKENILGFADKISPEVRVIGAANVVHFKKGSMELHNTDAQAITETLRGHDIDIHGASVLLFGAGGAARAACYALAENKAKSIFIVNRDVQKAEGLIREFSAHFPATSFSLLETPETRVFDLVINATSVGMAGVAIPHPSPFEILSQLKLSVAFDLIYRPADTMFLKHARSMGAKTIGGLDMLIDQALATWRLWFGPLSSEAAAKKTLQSELRLTLQKTGAGNIFLTGFMGAGKSTLGRKLAQKTGHAFADLDHIIEKRTGRLIRDIFQESGENYFRDIEAQILNEVTQQSNQVIALGGGALLNKENLEKVKEAGKLFYLVATQETILGRLDFKSGARPLLNARETTDELKARLAALFELRKPAYEQADYHISTDDLSEEAACDLILKEVIEAS